MHHVLEISLPEVFLTGLNEVTLLELLRWIRDASSLKCLASTNKQLFRVIANNQSLWQVLLQRYVCQGYLAFF